MGSPDSRRIVPQSADGNRDWDALGVLSPLPRTFIVTTDFPVNRNSLDLPQVFELAFVSYTNLLTLASEGFSGRSDPPLVANRASADALA